MLIWGEWGASRQRNQPGRCPSLVPGIGPGLGVFSGCALVHWRETPCGFNALRWCITACRKGSWAGNSDRLGAVPLMTSVIERQSE